MKPLRGGEPSPRSDPNPTTCSIGGPAGIPAIAAATRCVFTARSDELVAGPLVAEQEICSKMLQRGYAAAEKMAVRARSIRMDSARHVRLAAIVVFATSTAVAAQPAPSETAWSHGTTINVFGGVASASSKSGALAGGAAGWEITPWFGLEGSVALLDRPGSAEAFAAVLGAHANLMSPRAAVPFVKGGVGRYRASFDSLGDVIPHFYRRRMAGRSSALGMAHTFTDPSFVVGGGVNLFTTRHVAIRPEIEAVMVRRQSRSYVVTAVTLHLAYHFEQHPVTPARGGK